MADFFGQSLARQLDEESQTSTPPTTDQDSPFFEADYDLTELEGSNTTEQFETLINEKNKDRVTIYIPPGDYTVTKPLLFKKRIFLFGLKDNKPNITLKNESDDGNQTGMTLLAGGRINNINFIAGDKIKTLLQFGGTSRDKKNPNEDDVDGSIENSSFSNFKKAIVYNGRNCRIQDSTFDSQRKKSTDITLSYKNIEVDNGPKDGRGTLPHYSNRKNRFQGNTFSEGQDNTGIHVAGEVPVRGMLITDNAKNGGGRLLKVSGSGGIRDAVLSGNRISDVGSGQAPIVDLGTSEAQGLVIHGNQFAGLSKQSSLLSTATADLKGNPNAAKASQSNDARIHGLTITDNELQYNDQVKQSKSGMVKPSYTELQDSVAAEQVVGDDITWSGNRVTESLSEKPSRAKLGALEDNDVDAIIRKSEDSTDAFKNDVDAIICKPGDSTRAFQKVANKGYTRVRIEAGKHIVKKPIVFPHRLRLEGPESSGGSLSGRPKIIFKLSDAALEQQLPGFTFAAGGEIDRVTFKGGAKKGNSDTSANILQFGTQDGPNKDVSAHVKDCTFGHFKFKTAIANYGASSQIEDNAFSDAPGGTAISLISNAKGGKQGAVENNILRNQFHLGGKHTSVQVTGNKAREGLFLGENISDIGGRFLHVDGKGGLKDADIIGNTVQGEQARKHDAILDFEQGVLDNVNVAGNAFAGLDLDTQFAKASETKRYKKSGDKYSDADRAKHVVQVSEAAKIRKNGLQLKGNNLSFAKHGNEAISIDGKKNKQRTSVIANVIRNSKADGTDHKTADGGVSNGVGQLRGNVGSGDKKYSWK